MKLSIFLVFLCVTPVLFGMHNDGASGSSPIFSSLISTMDMFKQVQRYNNKKYPEGQALVLGINTGNALISDVQSEQRKNKEIYEKIAKIELDPSLINQVDENDWNAYAERAKLVDLYLKPLLTDTTLNDQERLRRINMLLCYHYSAFVSSLSLLVAEGIRSQNELQRGLEVSGKKGSELPPTLLSNIYATLNILSGQLQQLEIARPMKRMVPVEPIVTQTTTTTTTSYTTVPGNQQPMPASTQETLNQQVSQGKIVGDGYPGINELVDKIYPQNI